MDQPGKVANPARGQLNRENNIPLYGMATHDCVLHTGSKLSGDAPEPQSHDDFYHTAITNYTHLSAVKLVAGDTRVL